MANDLSNIMMKILARGLLALRGQIVMPRLVNASFSDEAASKGQTIDVPLPVAQSVSDVTPSSTPVTPTDKTPDVVQVPLNKWRKTDFYLTDKDMVEIDRNRDFLPMQTSEAVSAIASDVNAYIQGLYVRVPNLVGTPGTTPFASDAQIAIDARKKLHQLRAPKRNRAGVIDFDAEANALALSTFADIDKSDDRNVKFEGEIGRKYGFDWVADEDVQTHTAGSQTGDPTVSGAHAEGVSTVTIATDADDSFDYNVGDVISFAGDTQQYAVTSVPGAIGASSSGDVGIYPNLQTALAGGEAVTLQGTHVVNLAFHRDAFAFAMRPLSQSTTDMALGSQIVSMQDPETGIVMRLEVSRQNKQVVWEFDVLYGGILVRWPLAVRMAG